MKKVIRKIEKLLIKKKYQEVITYIDSLDSSCLQNRALLLLKADAFFQVGQIQDSFNILNLLYQQNPNNLIILEKLLKLFFTIHNYDDAIEITKVIEKVSPNHLDSLLIRGRCLLNLSNDEQALNCFKSVLDFNPKSNEANYHIANLYFKIHSLEKALFHYSISLKGNTNPTSIYINLSALYQQLGEFDLALSYSTKCLSIGVETFEFFQNYAHLQRKLGNSSIAKTYYLKALAVKPDDSHCIFSYATLNRFTQFDEFCVRVQQMSKVSKDEDKINLFYTLGKIFEDLGEFSHSFECYSQANSYTTQISSFCGKTFQSQSISYLNFNLNLSYEDNSYQMKHIPIFIVSLPRSGSTLVEQILSSHSQVGSVGESRIFHKILETYTRLHSNDFFEGLSSLNDGDFENIKKDYDTNITSTNANHLFVINKLPGNYVYALALKKIFTDSIILFVNRDPMACLLSCYKTLFTDNNILYSSFQNLTLAYRSYERSFVKLSPHMSGQYYAIQYEQLVCKSKFEIEKLLNYCKLPLEEACFNPHNNKSSISTASIDQARQKIYKDKTTYWENFKEQLLPLSKLISSGELLKK